MNEEDTMKLIKDAISLYGEDAQLIQTAEEVGELLTALSQYRRGRITKDELTVEIADVMIMLDCIVTMHDIQNLEEIMGGQYEKFRKQVYGQ